MIKILLLIYIVLLFCSTVLLAVRSLNYFDHLREKDKDDEMYVLIVSKLSLHIVLTIMGSYALADCIIQLIER